MGKGNSRLLDRVWAEIELRGYSLRKKRALTASIRKFINFHHHRDPLLLGKREIEAFLIHLEINQSFSTLMIKQVIGALLFLYREVLGSELPIVKSRVQSLKQRQRPVVLTAEEVDCLLAEIYGVRWLMASLLYGSGLRLQECLRLRVHDIDFRRRQIIVRSDEGGRDRVTILPDLLVVPLKRHIKRVQIVHEVDLSEGLGEVSLPQLNEHEYANAERTFGWQYLFPSDRLSMDAQAGKLRRTHVSAKHLRWAIRQRYKRANIAKPASCSALRHTFANRLLEQGQDVSRVRNLLG